jgi:hypothetical protein
MLIALSAKITSYKFYQGHFHLDCNKESRGGEQRIHTMLPHCVQILYFPQNYTLVKILSNDILISMLITIIVKISSHNFHPKLRPEVQYDMAPWYW